MNRRSEILAVLKKHFKEVVEDWNDDKFDPDQTLAEMGVDSFDTFHVLFNSMKELQLKLSQILIFPKTSINQIVDSLETKEEEKNEADGTNDPSTES